jgi:peptidoglycan/LPS O-acetylase OafA/YrhL
VTTKQEPYPAYIFRRFMRLFPVFFVVIVGFVLISVFVRLKALPWDSLPSHLLAHVFMLHGPVPNEILERASDSIVPPAWSLVAPFLIGAIAQPRWWLVIGLALVAALSIWSGLHLGVDLTWRHEAFLPLRAELSMVGILFYRFLPLIPAYRIALICCTCPCCSAVRRGVLLPICRSGARRA